MSPISRVAAVAFALLLGLAPCGCAQWMGEARRALREPGEHLIDLPERVAKDYSCDDLPLPHLEVEHSEINPTKVHPGDTINHRMVYALCPEATTDVVTGTLITQVRFKGHIVMRDQSPGFEFKPGRWSVDTFVRLPKDAETGIYALEIRFHEGNVNVDESLTFGVDKS